MKLWIDFLCFSELNDLRKSILAAQRKWKSPRQFKRLRVYAHETVVKAFVNLNIELSSIQAIKTAVNFAMK